ncbi:MAG TPA: RNA polymerase sigma factor [Candidatus Paceibacterota bacterium]|nr:RNA polymerase sigma factor [Candidatus Paceibacterota bacterium]
MRDRQREFGEAYSRYADELFRHCSLRIKDRERALDLTQETFMKAWAFIERGGEVREVRPFLYRTLRNLIIDEYRKIKPHSLEAMIENEDVSVEVLLPADETNTLEAAIDRFEGAHALEVLNTLPEPYKEVLLLRYVSGFSPSEIATELGESENAVSVRIHRGLKKMRKLLEEENGI